MLIIRNQQLKAFGNVIVESFVRRMCIHLRKSFADQCSLLDDASLCDAIRYGIKQARKHGIKSEREVCQYIDMMFTFGRDFDTDPALPWATHILTGYEDDPHYSRIDRLRAKAKKHLGQARGFAPTEEEA